MFHYLFVFFFFFQAEDGIRDKLVTGVQTCALPILRRSSSRASRSSSFPPSTRRSSGPLGARSSNVPAPSRSGHSLPTSSSGSSGDDDSFRKGQTNAIESLSRLQRSVRGGVQVLRTVPAREDRGDAESRGHADGEPGPRRMAEENSSCPPRRRRRGADGR